MSELLGNPFRGSLAFPLLVLIALLILGFLSFTSISASASGSVIPDPCGGSGELLSVFSVSSCVVKPGQVLLEGEVQKDFFNNEGGNSVSVSYPQAEIRVGIPEGNEIKLFPPGYNMLEYPGSGASAVSGYGDSGIGFKHEFGYTDKTISAADIIVTFPSGTGGFQNYGTDVTVNAMLTYAVTEKLSVLSYLGMSSLTGMDNGGMVHRFFSFNPDMVFSYQPAGDFSAYAEIKRNAQGGVGFSGNYWADLGIQFLPVRKFLVQFEYGAFLDPAAGDSARYIEFETGILF